MPGYLHKRKNRGFTIVELLIALAVFLLVLAIGYQVYFFGQSSWGRVGAQARITQEVRPALMRLSRDVRGALSPDQATGVEPVAVSPDGDSLTVYADTTGDGRLERITYSWTGAGTPLERTVDAPTEDDYPFTYPDDLSTAQPVIEQVVNAADEPLFELVGTANRPAIRVYLDIMASEGAQERSIDVRVEYAVRQGG